MSGKDFIYLEPNDDLQSVIKCMEQNLISHVPIVLDKKIVGMVSKTDVIDCFNNNKESEEVLSSFLKRMNVQEIMTQPVIRSSVEETQMQMVEKMMNQKVGSLILYENEKVVGIVTEKDMMKFLAASQEKGQSFSDRFGYHLVNWLETHGVIRVSRFLSDMGI